MFLALALVAWSLAFIGLPFYFQHVLNLSVVATGFLLTPWPVVVALAAPIAGRLSDRYPPGLLGGAGLAILAIGMALLAMMPVDTGTAGIVARVVVCGIGFGLFQSPNINALMRAAPAARSGGASGMVAISRMVGQTVGAASAALCFRLFADDGPTAALYLGAAFSLVAALASIARLWAPDQRG